MCVMIHYYEPIDMALSFIQENFHLYIYVCVCVCRLHVEGYIR